jgi:tetratricopeptide (TPR) repeat protein
MIPLKKYVKTFGLLVFLVSNGYSQNLYDLDHTKKYADFLFQSRQYKLAAMEFERLLFMDPENKTARIQLIKSCRFSDQFNQAITHIRLWYPDQITDEDLFREYYKLNMLNGDYNEAIHSLENQSFLTRDESKYYRASSLLMQKKWDEASEYFSEPMGNDTPGFAELSELAARQNQIKYRKPGMALAFSTLVPGLGKVYSHDWKDGIISFLFVATNAFQAYRGFSRDGIDSVYGWIFGGLALGFYTGNLYGSWKSARDYNRRSEDIIYHDIQESIFSRF